MDVENPTHSTENMRVTASTPQRRHGEPGSSRSTMCHAPRVGCMRASSSVVGGATRGVSVMGDGAGITGGTRKANPPSPPISKAACFTFVTTSVSIVERSKRTEFGSCAGLTSRISMFGGGGWMECVTSQPTQFPFRCVFHSFHSLCFFVTIRLVPLFFAHVRRPVHQVWNQPNRSCDGLGFVSRLLHR